MKNLALHWLAAKGPAAACQHHCHIVATGNESYRFLHSTAVAKKRIKAREQARRADKQPPPEADI